MIWWAWMVLGLLLLVAEMVVPGLFLLFFGVAGLAVGMLTYLGMAGPAWMQWLMFSILSIVSLLLFREPLMRKLGQREAPLRDVDTLIGEVAIAAGDIPVNGTGKAEMRGASWNVRNVAEQIVMRGQRCRVTAVDGLQLLIKPE